MTAAFLRKT